MAIGPLQEGHIFWMVLGRVTIFLPKVRGGSNVLGFSSGQIWEPSPRIMCDQSLIEKESVPELLQCLLIRHTKKSQETRKSFAPCHQMGLLFSCCLPTDLSLLRLKLTLISLSFFIRIFYIRS